MSLLDEILATLDAMPPEQLVKFETRRRERSAIWVPNAGPQREAFDSDADELFYGGSAGGGKGGRPDDHVLTPFGWRKYRDLRVGDAVCAVDGTVTRVIGIYPRGVQPTYRLTWSDGATTVVDADHIWRGWWTGKTRKIGNDPTGGEASIGNWITTEIAERAATGTAGRFAIPVMEPCAFNVAGEKKGRNRFIKRSIPPYVLGALLGDGSMTANQVSWAKPDEQIVDLVKAALSRAGMGDDVVSRRESEGKCPCFGISTRTGVREHLADLGLMGLQSEQKFIPRIYLLASIDERWELLRGLMDTDGWSEEDGDCYFASSSMRLVDDVTHLARSLGAIVSRREKNPTFTYLGDKRNGLPSVTLRIKMQRPDRMFHLERKAERCRDVEYRSMGRYLERIERHVDQDTICIRVRHPSSLYVTDDFVVTHNTDLIVGLSLTQHKRSLVLRRTNKEASKLVERFVEVIGHRNGWNGQENTWRFPDGRLVDIGGVQHEDDKQKFKGTPHDGIFWDEVSDFSETQFRFINTWNRTADPKQRCRIVCAGNPPTQPSGLWVIKYWGPWLDPTHPRPAQPGELRWFTTIGGEDVEVDGPGPHLVGGEHVRAKSRTFIPARLEDNPDLARTNYAAVLAALPEELRAAYKDGRFDASMKDDEWQVIPTAWIMDAQKRWSPKPPQGAPMVAIGVDVAAGGSDETVLAMRHDWWFAPLVSMPGSETPNPGDAAALVVKHRRDQAAVVIDCGGGYGGGVAEFLSHNGIAAVKYVGASSGHGRTKDRVHAFANKRAETWWRFREALDPDQPGGSPIALPEDPAIRADLAAPRWQLTPRGIRLEEKDDIKKRLGRSPDKGDAIVMSWSEGQSALRRGLSGPGTVVGAARIADRPAYATVGHANAKRRR